MRCTVDLLSPRAVANFRQVQWVLPSSGACLDRRSGFAPFAPFMKRIQSCHAVLLKAALPSSYRRSRRMQLEFDLAPAFAFG
jgi:hypothetical protein